MNLIMTFYDVFKIYTLQLCYQLNTYYIFDFIIKLDRTVFYLNDSVKNLKNS